MKYTVQGRQPMSLLKKVDEIKVEYRDREQILDFIEKIPEKTFILEIPKDAILDENLVEAFAEKIEIILELPSIDLSVIQWCKEKNIKWYWKYPITSYFELRKLAALGPSYLLLGAPLCFDLPTVKKIGIPIRLIANLAGDRYIPQLEGICGPWIRPEGILAYEPYVDSIEFVSTGLQQEATLYKIYAEDKEWPGNLNFLFQDFNCNVQSPGLPVEIDEMRTNCRQKCMENGHCRFCEIGVKFSHALTEYLLEKEENN